MRGNCLRFPNPRFSGLPEVLTLPSGFLSVAKGSYTDNRGVLGYFLENSSLGPRQKYYLNLEPRLLLTKRGTKSYTPSSSNSWRTTQQPGGHLCPKKTKQVAKLDVRVVRKNWKGPEPLNVNEIWNVDWRDLITLERASNDRSVSIRFRVIDSSDSTGSIYSAFNFFTFHEELIEVVRQLSRKVLKGSHVPYEGLIVLKVGISFVDFLKVFAHLLETIEGCQVTFLGYREELPGGMTIEEELEEDLLRRTYRLCHRSAMENPDAWHQDISRLGLRADEAIVEFGLTFTGGGAYYVVAAPPSQDGYNFDEDGCEKWVLAQDDLNETDYESRLQQLVLVEITEEQE